MSFRPLTNSVEEKLERDSLQEVLARMDVELGPVPAEKLAWADQIVDRIHGE